MSNKLQSWTLKRVAAIVLTGAGALSAAGIVAALVLPDPDAPSEINYNRCIERAAEKAQGSAQIFYALRVRCLKLSPPSKTQGMFDDLMPAQPPPH